MSRISDEFRRTFSSVNASRNFRLFFVGQLVSQTGTWFTATASAVLVLRLSNSGTALGLSTALLFLPVLLFGAIGGVLADRFDKRRILMLTQTAFATVALVEWSLVLTGSVRLWMVYLLSFAAGMATAVDNPTRQSFYTELVGESNLTNAISLNSSIFTGTRVFGSALAGYLIHAAGLASCFLIDGVSYLAILVALASMRRSEMHLAHERPGRQRANLGEGLRYVWGSPALRRPLILMAVVFTMCFNFMVLVPLQAERTFHGDARTLGLLSAMAGVGMFLGAIAMANRATAPTGRRLALFTTLFGVFLFTEGLAPTLAAALLLMVPLGVAGMLFAITANSTLQLASRPEMRGRVMAIYGVVFLGSTPIGSPLMGWIGEHVGSRAGFLVGGVVAVGVGLVALAMAVRSTEPRAAMVAAD
ncbi:MAG: MFS transporter [Actinobacteria bacterium]|nr:MFS transporter [Actinomycetota bacterium]